MKTIGQTAMVRILFDLKGLGVMDRQLRPTIEIKKSQVFPLAFVFSEDHQVEVYDSILKELNQSPQKILNSIPTNESGFYELVARYEGEAFFDSSYQGSRWSLEDVKVYQLTSEEVASLNLSN